MVTITEDVDGKGTVVVRADDKKYQIFYDEYTSDWGIWCPEDERIQSPWFRSENGAVQYTLACVGLISFEDANYSFAPDRC